MNLNQPDTRFNPLGQKVAESIMNLQNIHRKADPDKLDNEVIKNAEGLLNADVIAFTKDLESRLLLLKAKQDKIEGLEDKVREASDHTTNAEKFSHESQHHANLSKEHADKAKDSADKVAAIEGRVSDLETKVESLEKTLKDFFESAAEEEEYTNRINIANVIISVVAGIFFVLAAYASFVSWSLETGFGLALPAIALTIIQGSLGSYRLLLSGLRRFYNWALGDMSGTDILAALGTGFALPSVDVNPAVGAVLARRNQNQRRNSFDV